MASQVIEEEQIINPFKFTNETDVVVQIEDTTLYLHSAILSIYSPVLKEMLEIQQQEKKSGCKIITGIKCNNLKDIITFFEFFYPEYKLSKAYGKKI